MERMKPTIVVSSEDPGNWSRRVSVDWPATGWHTSGDNPAAHGGSGTAPDGFDLLGAALGVCMVTTLMAGARRERVPLTRADAHISWKARLRGGNKAPYITDFHVDIYLQGEVSEEQRAALEEWTARMCGTRESLQRIQAISECVHIGSPPKL